MQLIYLAYTYIEHKKDLKRLSLKPKIYNENVTVVE